MRAGWALENVARRINSKRQQQQRHHQLRRCVRPQRHRRRCGARQPRARKGAQVSWTTPTTGHSVATLAAAQRFIGAYSRRSEHIAFWIMPQVCVCCARRGLDSNRVRCKAWSREVVQELGAAAVLHRRWAGRAAAGTTARTRPPPPPEAPASPAAAPAGWRYVAAATPRPPPMSPAAPSCRPAHRNALLSSLVGRQCVLHPSR